MKPQRIAFSALLFVLLPWSGAGQQASPSPQAENTRPRAEAVPSASPTTSPEPEKTRPPLTIAVSELKAFDYDVHEKAFYFTHNKERYWYHISRADPDAKANTGLLLLQQLRAAKAVRIESLAEPLNGFVIVKNIVLMY